PPAADELGDLGRAFNGLLDRLAAAFERERRFTAEASHQLRTPLAGIIGQVEVALRRDRPADEYRRALEAVLAPAGRLRRGGGGRGRSCGSGATAARGWRWTIAGAGSRRRTCRTCSARSSAPTRPASSGCRAPGSGWRSPPGSRPPTAGRSPPGASPAAAAA